ncbi:unnamed protein product [Timema podura]|uniref:Poly [ADP-ribose] polymerase n=1 Tax=Timema podura TaxID=61482 RepID=A0ABN7ND65_TIMPD|nr:unnamed protein product [Timema podura]
METDRNETLAKSSEMHRNPTAAEGINLNTQSSSRLDVDSKLSALRAFIEKDRLAADIKWSMFVSACQSYRYDSCLKPFPPQFLVNNVKDIDALFADFFFVVGGALTAGGVKSAGPPSLSVGIFLCVYASMMSSWTGRSEGSLYDMVMDHVDSETVAQPPNFIFQLISGAQNSQAAKWLSLAHSKKTMFGFHGSRLENFHSILHHGLQQHMNKNSLFGHGVYLSSELSVSLPYSPSGYGWGRSLLGSQMSCIALCEMIDHPDVKCKTGESNRSRSITSDSIGGEVPEKYYVVQNSDLVRVRYLLVYCNNTTVNSDRNSWVNWLSRHKLLTFIIGYIFMLASIGFTSNPMSNVENMSPQIIRRVVKEMTDLVTHPPEGIKVSINDEDVTDIQAYIDGPAGTPYTGGVFRVKLALSKDFPQTPPKAFFITKIFHPNVAKNGEICVNTLKKDWKPDLGIKHILLMCKVPKAGLEGGVSSVDGPLAKKHAGDKRVPADKKKQLKDKKKTLKRL